MLWVWKRSLVDQLPIKKAASLLLRCLGVVCLILALCRPFLKQDTEDAHFVYLVDISQSIDPTSLDEAHQWISDSIKQQRSNDSSDIFLFASSIQSASLESLKLVADQAAQGTAESDLRNSTPIAKALRSMRTSFPSDKAKKLIILSDAKNTEEASDESIEMLKQEGIEIVYHSLESLKKPEASVLSLTPSTHFAYQGEILRLNANILSNTDQQVEARLLHRGIVVARSMIQLSKDVSETVSFDTEMHTSGINEWAVEIEPKSDYFQSNNKASTTIKVKGHPRFLVIHQDEKQMRPFARAMQKQGIALEVRGEFGIPKSFNELLAYDGIILANISATSLDQQQMNDISRYVTDFGGGILMLGSDNSFGLGGYFKTPIEDVLPLTSRYEKEKQKPSLAMVLVIDKSGSMSGTPIAMARASALAAAELLSPNDQIAVLGFDGAPQLICPLTSASDQVSIQSAISSLEASGGTNLYPAMVEGRNILDEATAKIKHMIILSDGQTQEADFTTLTQEMANDQMTVSTVALGSGAAKDLMQRIASEGMGRYYETNDPAKMPQIFTKETMKASRSSIKEDLFGTLVIGDHPLLNGYEDSELPFVLGYVMTRPKPTAQVLLAAESGDPLLAISRYGLGMGAAYTSDLTELWGSEWLTSANGIPFWAQALRSIARKEESAGLSASIHQKNESLEIHVRRSDSTGQSIENVPWNLKASDQSGKDIDFQLTQTGLGSYKGTIQTNGKERINLRLHDELADLTKSLTWQRSYPAEYQLSNTQDPALALLPTPSIEELYSNIPSASVYQNISWVFVLAGFTSCIGGLVLRRL
ncbi:VWA domain-containing protein [Rubritalea sp.]|uniref:VWA domain-containing protein n=1 Tax=Rubritalea sp. TaxID=2109375 RepID=UPI003EF392FA